MITIQQYFGSKAHTQAQEDSAIDLLERVDRLTSEAEAVGQFRRRIDPDTGSEISGSPGGAGDGGFRLPTSTTGTATSSHREARAVDVYDPANELDTWLNDFEDGQGGNSKLEEYGLYREHPDATIHWCHFTTRPPRSLKRTFRP